LTITTSHKGIIRKTSTARYRKFKLFLEKRGRKERLEKERERERERGGRRVG